MKILQLFTLFIGLSLLGPSSLMAQRTAIYTHDLKTFDNALSLYRQKQYKPAMLLFKEAANQTNKDEVKAQAAFYRATSAVRLGQNNADELMNNYVRNYPASTKRNSAFLNVANYYFRSGSFQKSRKWYKKADKSSLSSSQKEEYYFKKGYSAFKTNHKKSAKRMFKRVLNSDKYGENAKYYLGFMAYKGDEYRKAKDYFEEVEGRENQRNLNYFRSDINFNQGNFKEAIRLGKKQLERSGYYQSSELNKIIGESYFNLGKYKKAIPYLEKYEGKRGRWSNTDYYQLGYAYYKLGKYQKAINQFNKIIDGKGSVAQNAYYHLADSYLELGKKQQALNAFKNASEMKYDKKIQRDAAFNYAKLSYEIGNTYESVPKILTNFLKKYPKADGRKKIKSLLIDSYVASNNYKKALELLAASNDFEDKLSYQKISYRWGIELYKDGKFAKAIEAFNKSLSERINQEIMAKATFWRAESNFNLGNFQKALIGYKSFKGMPVAKTLPEYKDIDYNIGYIYFKQQDYKNALKHFENYTKSSPANSVQLNDAYLRLGDSYFALSEYWEAMETYNKAIGMKGVDNDYAYFQKAISYAFVGKNQRKIEDLKAFLERYPKSIYRDDAFYELGNTYVAEGKTKKAVQAYSTLINQYPNSVYVSNAMIKKGLVYYNTDQGGKAIKTFKAVVAQFPKTEDAKQAVQNARTVYVDLGQTGEYAKWVNTLDFVNVTDADIDNATYAAAEKKFLNNKTKEAIRAFENYLNKFPNGLHLLSANFYLAQLYYGQNKGKKAIPHYKYVVNQARNQFTEISLARLSRLYLEKGNYEKAIPVLKQLKKVADFPQNITFAQTNLMKAYYKQGDYQKSITMAETVLKNEGVNDDVKSDAKVFIARSAIEIGNKKRARKAYRKVAEIADGKLAAEALYYKAYFKRKDKKYKKSNQIIQKLGKNYSGFKKFGAKALLLMAKNFYDLEDAYQATFILENLIKNFKQFPKVIAEAKSTLKNIKAKEAKTNSSIKTGKN